MDIQTLLREQMTEHTRTLELPSGAARAALNAAVRTRTRQLAMTSAGVAAAVAVSAAVVADIGTGGSTSNPPANAAVETIRLAGYVFKLPDGYVSTAKLCRTPPTSALDPGGRGRVPAEPLPVVGGNTYAAAASADGGCVQAVMASGGPPPNTEHVRIGSYNGYLFQREGLLGLYLKLPPSKDNGLDLLLTSTGLTTGQLEQVAASGLN